MLIVFTEVKLYFVGGVKEIVDGYVTDHIDSCIMYDFGCTKTFEDLASLLFGNSLYSACVVTKLGSNTFYEGVRIPSVT